MTITECPLCNSTDIEDHGSTVASMIISLGETDKDGKIIKPAKCSKVITDLIFCKKCKLQGKIRSKNIS